MISAWYTTQEKEIAMADTGVAELSEQVGWEGELATSGMRVGVRVTDVRSSGFGRVDYRVVPLYGGGGESAWLSSIRFAKYGDASE